MVSSELQTLWGLKLLRVWQTTRIWQKPLAGNSSLAYFTYSLANTLPTLVVADNAPVTNISDVNTAAAYSKVTASSAVGVNTNRRPQLTIMSMFTHAEGPQARMDPDRPHSSVPYPCSFPGYITTEKQNSPLDSFMSQGWQEPPEGLPSTFNIVLYKADPTPDVTNPVSLASIYCKQDIPFHLGSM